MKKFFYTRTEDENQIVIKYTNVTGLVILVLMITAFLLNTFARPSWLAWIPVGICFVFCYLSFSVLKDLSAEIYVAQQQNVIEVEGSKWKFYQPITYTIKKTPAFNRAVKKAQREFVSAVIDPRFIADENDQYHA